jgi:Radical SAM superfamily/Iron-sulfur cluster-binding domain
LKLQNPEVRIENCSICNGKCTICPRDKFTRTKMIMTNKHFSFLVDQAKDLGAETISIFGFGEPLMDRAVDWKVQYCSSLGLETFITTNASVLGTDLSHRLIAAGLSHIRFSCHGIGANYEKVHRGFEWQQIMRNISNFNVINKAKFNHATKVSVSVIPMHGETVDEIRDFWGNHVDYLEIWKPHNWVSTKDYRKGTPVKQTCFRPFTGPLQINADGTVMICCFDFNGKMTVGCTYCNSLEDIVKGVWFKDIRDRHRRQDFKDLPCETCDQLYEYAEDENPLLYSNRDKERKIGVTSSTKFCLNGEKP